MYIGPSTEEEDLPENASYNADDEKFFSFNQFDFTDFPIDAGKICEAGNICEILILSILILFHFCSNQVNVLVKN